MHKCPLLYLPHSVLKVSRDTSVEMLGEKITDVASRAFYLISWLATFSLSFPYSFVFLSFFLLSVSKSWSIFCIGFDPHIWGWMAEAAWMEERKSWCGPCARSLHLRLLFRPLFFLRPPIDRAVRPRQRRSEELSMLRQYPTIGRL